ncbi:amino acid adenylation domain-containing protein, partial [Actinosynnema sp. NPDC023658]|uniref:amino acid adenylation domain-containing protein n=1 Tax=Actinosynnema sp. NPDC023658 TaxID=3155465 RepID=UPI003407FBB3
REEAFAPCYGLAEATLLVSGVRRAQRPRTITLPATGDRPATTTVSCGRIAPERVVVVKDGAPVPDGTEGEIWVRGPSVAEGYWGNADATERTFGQRLVDLGDGFLRTGDLGMIADGELAVTGRLKDLMIVRGRNHHPADLEATVRAVDARLRPRSTAVFAVAEDVIVVQATAPGLRDEHGRLVEAIRAAVAETHGLRVADVVLVRPGGIPTTSSGKVRRAACRSAYLAGRLPVVAAADTPASPVTGTRAAEVVAEVLGVGPTTVDVDRPLSAMGVDSLRAMQLQQAFADAFGVVPDIRAILGGATVRELAATTMADVPPRVAGADHEHELTWGQQGLWLLSRLNEGGARAYRVTKAVRLPEDVDLARLGEAIRQLVTRHAQLRSRFSEVAGSVTRGVWEPQDQPWFHVRDVGTDAWEAAVEQEAATPLDLVDGPHFRAVALRAEDRSPVLVVSVSHLVVDMWSFGVLVAELGRCYDEAMPPSGEVPSFGTVVAAEQAWLASPDSSALAGEWALELLEAPPLALPYDRQHRGATTFAGDALVLTFPGEVLRSLRAVSAESGCTPFAVLLAVVHTWLARLTGQSEVVVGVPMALRGQPGLELLVGYLVNTVPIHLDDPGPASLREHAVTARQALLTGLARARLPIATLTREVTRRVGSAAAPLFRATCSFYDDELPGTGGLAGLALDVPGAVARAGSLELRSVPLPTRSALADLDAEFGVVGDELVLRLTYSTEVFDRETAHALAGRLRSTVATALGEPDLPLRALPLPRDLTSVVVPDPFEVPDTTLGALFYRQARQDPAAIALVQADREWTYGQLLALAGHWGERIDDGTDATTVGLVADRSPEFVVAMLSILFSGRAFLPLAPDLPQARLASMAADAGVDLVVTTDEHLDVARSIVSREPVVVSMATTDGIGHPRPASSADLAYVVHTSGTTGKPKAVGITHANVLPLLLWEREEFGAGPGMRLGQTLALSFDYGLQEVFTTVLLGGTLCLPLPHERYYAPDYARFLARDRIGTLFLTPTFAHELVAAGVAMPHVDLIQVAGEVLTGDLVARLRELAAPGCRIYNGYGPTETSINCAVHLVPPGAGAPDVVPVGSPSGLSALYVLDHEGHAVGERIPGEVFVGGPGVAAGYLGDTGGGSRFLDDPFQPGGRMYRTGDRGRWVDGHLVVTGRMDQQAKVRGYRVEPGEVESVRREHPGVRQCAVVVDPRSRSPRLLAFVTGDDLDPTAVQEFAALHLPHYAVPSRITVLAALPRTSHGKLAVRALLALAEPTAPTAARRTDSPSLPVVIEVWRDALGLSEVDPDANFFGLGGHSLMIGQVAARLRERTSVDLPVAALFRYVTARSLAQHLDDARTTPGVEPTRTRALGARRRVRGRQHAPVTDLGADRRRDQ